MWYPLRQDLFYPSDFVREDRALAALREARITVVPRLADRDDTPAV
ncbi:MAG TPA: hypothetical protein VKH36_09405 [Acidimicrobiia bacterium]|nr:hypothetical protein [Acidimicrobiia bacterium]